MESISSIRIRVRVCVPGSVIREIHVCPEIQVHDFKRYLPNPACELMYSGAVMLDGATLASYNVQSDDFIISIAKQGGRSVFNQQSITWARLTKDNEAFTERMRCILNPNVANELARLKDLRILRLSERPGVISKLHQIYTVQQEKQATAPENAMLVTDELNEPSISPLPVLWDGNEIQDEVESTHPRSKPRLQSVVC